MSSVTSPLQRNGSSFDTAILLPASRYTNPVFSNGHRDPCLLSMNWTEITRSWQEGEYNPLTGRYSRILIPTGTLHTTTVVAENLMHGVKEHPILDKKFPRRWVHFMGCEEWGDTLWFRIPMSKLLIAMGFLPTDPPETKLDPLQKQDKPEYSDEGTSISYPYARATSNHQSTEKRDEIIAVSKYNQCASAGFKDGENDVLFSTFEAECGDHGGMRQLVIKHLEATGKLLESHLSSTKTPNDPNNPWYYMPGGTSLSIETALGFGSAPIHLQHGTSLLGTSDHQLGIELIAEALEIGIFSKEELLPILKKHGRDLGTYLQTRPYPDAYIQLVCQWIQEVTKMEIASSHLPNGRTVNPYNQRMDYLKDEARVQMAAKQAAASTGGIFLSNPEEMEVPGTDNSTFLGRVWGQAWSSISSVWRSARIAEDEQRLRETPADS